MPIVYQIRDCVLEPVVILKYSSWYIALHQELSMPGIHFDQTRKATEPIVTFNPVSREVRSWHEEACIAARAIAAYAEKHIWLCASGGIASAAMLQAFQESGVHFSVLSINHASIAQRLGVESVRLWCLERGIEHYVRELDSGSFVASDITRFVAEGLRAPTIEEYRRLKMLEIIEEIGGFGVLGAGAFIFGVDQNEDAAKSTTILSLDTSWIMPYQWMTLCGVRHEPYFFMSTPEICLSYLREPVVRAAITHPQSFRNERSAFLLRKLSFQIAWPMIQLSEKRTERQPLAARIRALDEGIQNRFRILPEPITLAVPEIIQQLEGTS